MAKINRFEDIEAWQEARKLSKEIYTLSQTTKLQSDFSLKDQILRSSGSVMDNIAEGFERGGRKEFIQFLSIAKGSCGETRSQLYRMADRLYIDQPAHNKLSLQAESISKRINAFIQYLKNSEIQGMKYNTSKP